MDYEEEAGGKARATWDRLTDFELIFTGEGGKTFVGEQDASCTVDT